MTDSRIENLERRISDASGTCSRIDDGILRQERNFDSKAPYAVTYFNLTGKLPETPEALLGFQEKYIAKNFFEGPKHLKWNQYLIFVVPDQAWKQVVNSETRKWIEQDTTYTKKVIVSDTELDSLLFGIKWHAGAGAVAEPPQEKWLRPLRELGLDKILYAKSRSRAVKRWIDSEEVESEEPAPSDKQRLETPKAGKLTEIKWTKYRKWPKPPCQFQFSDVNLICGPNAVGKTSLLEAIEYFFCGEMHRDRDAVTNDMLGKIDGHADYLKPPASPKSKRDRDLYWFGAYWRQKDELAKSFNRYIFYNSDAAFQLQQSTDNRDITTALINVALGQDTSILWGYIKEFRVEFKNQSSVIGSKFASLRADRDGARRELKQLTASPMLAEKMLAALQPDLNGIGWRSTPSKLDDFENNFSQKILEVYEAVEAIQRLPRNVSSLKGLEKFIDSLSTRKSRARTNLRSLQRSQDERNELQVSRDKLLPRAKAVRRLGEYISVGWTGSWFRMKEGTVALKRISKVHKATGTINVNLLTALDDRKSTAILLRENEEIISKVEDELNRKKKEAERLRQHVTDLEAIQADAGALGHRLIKADPDVSECPVCGHVHGVGELKRRIQQRRSANVGRKALSELAEQVTAISKRLRQHNDIQTNLRAVEGLLDDLRLIADVRIGEPLNGLLKKLQGIDVIVDATVAQISANEKVLRRLEDRGFDETEFRERFGEVFRGEIKETTEWANSFENRIKDEEKEIERSERKMISALKAVESKIDLIEKDLVDLYKGYGVGKDYEEHQTKLESALDTLLQIKAEMVTVSKLCIVKPDSDLRQFSSKLNRVYSQAKELVNTVSEEKVRRQTIAVFERNVLEIEKKINELTPKAQRAERGTALFEKLFKEHSIEKDLNDFINANHERISSILVDIHSPKEFSGIESWDGSGGIRLIRNDGNKTRAELCQISTGQRSAVALSIFLTLNEKLKTAPPLLIFDDPVAHVDDLNMLAFVDYLREIAKTRTRQIFFASANDKVTAIFQQKFFGLKDIFRPLELNR